MQRFEWPEKRQFKSTFACKSLPGVTSGRFVSSILAPISNLLPVISQLDVFLFSWAILISIFAIVHQLPIGIWNSSDKQYIDNYNIMITTGIAYFILSFFLTNAWYSSGCSILTDQAQRYLYAPKPPMPSYLEDSL